MWTLPGQGLNLSLTCGNAISFNSLRPAGIKPTPRYQPELLQEGFLAHCATAGTPYLQVFCPTQSQKTKAADFSTHPLDQKGILFCGPRHVTYPTGMSIPKDLRSFLALMPWFPSLFPPCAKSRQRRGHVQAGCDLLKRLWGPTKERVWIWFLPPGKEVSALRSFEGIGLGGARRVSGAG